ncbi:uncharacterized protein BX663DRAFT_434811 [Cokeromyces recurvatus]|uniref:uncharacterized protein n=1 Tax=Cokeromyces recurvatus TaxID=90255 RepID=UPI002220BC44|nr:uncharacterized protein BX663DRAFT_434811 [Cokeromyces recurvatus]KAI7902818.1 hypothetical protein BX663DRAFT_434811 [Cokeromyces recurvatus]
MSECNRINSIGVSWLARGCINLQTLSLAYQAGVTDQAIQLFINNCHQLKHMDISGCQLLTDHAFLPLLETEENKSVNIQLEKLNMSGLDLLSTSLIHHILNKLESLQELCLGVTYDLDQAYRILETINSCEPRFYLDTGKYYTICKIRAPLMLPYTCNRAPTNVNKATATNISRILTLPSSSTWNLPTSLFPL